MIKVLQVYDSFAVSSGISAVMINWLNNNSSSDVKFDFLCCWRKEPSYEKELLKYNSKLFYIEDSDGISNYFSFITKVKRFMKDKANDYDIIHLHSSIFSFPILYYAKKYGIRHRIVHIHSSSLGNTKMSSYRNLVSLLPMKMLSNYFFACSEEAAKIWYEPIGIKNYSVLYNGIDLSKFSKNNVIRKKYREILNVDDETVLLGHISNMSPLKNIPFLIDLLKELVENGQPVKLAFIGKNELPVDINNLIKTNKLDNYVINIGETSIVNKYIQAIDIGLMPSISEGFGLVPIEFQAAQIPVLISNHFPKVIAATDLSKVLPLKIDEWSAEISNLISSENEDYEPFNISDKLTNFEISYVTNEVINKYREIIKQN